MNFPTINKGEQKKFIFFGSIRVQYQWNEIKICLTFRLSIPIPRSKSKSGANVPLLEKMVFSLINLRQQRLLNVSI